MLKHIKSQKEPDEAEIEELLFQMIVNMQLTNEVALLALIFLERIIVS